MILMSYFNDSIRTQEEVDKLMSELYDDKTIYGSWNFDDNPDKHQPDIHDLELVMRNYVDYIEETNNSEIYCFCISCMGSFITAPFDFEGVVHLIRVVHSFYHDYRVIYTIHRVESTLQLEFHIIPHELSTGDIYEFSEEEHCGQIMKLSDEILARRMQKETADK